MSTDATARCQVDHGSSGAEVVVALATESRSTDAAGVGDSAGAFRFCFLFFELMAFNFNCRQPKKRTRFYQDGKNGLIGDIIIGTTERRESAIGVLPMPYF